MRRWGNEGGAYLHELLSCLMMGFHWICKEQLQIACVHIPRWAQPSSWLVVSVQTTLAQEATTLFMTMYTELRIYLKLGYCLCCNVRYMFTSFLLSTVKIRRITSSFHNIQCNGFDFAVCTIWIVLLHTYFIPFSTLVQSGELRVKFQLYNLFFVICGCYVI